ncbi:DUF305 domain-containing protein [Microbacterium oxydans]|uniref:DUF305 domain-containing protein n=1 Tax=Microbacterium oxydans TaxID=82380 RepID=A0A0F0LDF3_9MICO|nr:DUF305 domain-containing protein [Microbacterium oxydans]KJL29591.1 hypothetical protein RS83_01608 [Microbacterium oxydans]
MKIRPAAIAALTLTAVLTFTGCAGGTGSGDDMDGMDHGGSSSAPAETADANEADIMFARMMIEHHTQAVDMSDTILGKEGIDEQVTALAEDIKAAQQPEIEKMESWLQDWDAADTDTGEMDHGGGMMTEEDMQALDDATGVEASRLFLEQMIEHHNGAIDMAQDEIDNGQNSDAVNLAQTIVDTQTAEITTMEEILAIL